MFRYLILILMTALILISSGCQPVNVPKYTYLPPESKPDKMCAIRCYSAKKYCEQICQMKNPGCFMREEELSALRFNLYRLETLRAGKTITKSAKDFNYRDRCLASCQCTSSFNTCYVACGGEVNRMT